MKKYGLFILFIFLPTTLYAGEWTFYAKGLLGAYYGVSETKGKNKYQIAVVPGDGIGKEVMEAAKAARAHHFIQTLPGGYQMELNEDASNVSQGQKQLLCIARIMLIKPPMLILDEATSSVDTRTEQLIQKAMDMAAGAGPDNIARYLAVLLQDWGSHGVHTQEELNEYLAKRDAEKLNEMLNSPILTPMFALK